jgi:hypothetical protein
MDSKDEIQAPSTQHVSAALSAAPFFIGAALGALTRMRIVFLALPALAIATVYWVAVGWKGDDYDIGREGLILLTAFLGVTFVSLWVVGSVVGRLFRLGFER